MNKRVKALITASVFFMANFTFSVCSSKVKAQENTNKVRIYGHERCQTSVKVSQKGWSQGAETVIIIRGDEFADGICAAPLARKYSAPILLTYPEELHSTVEEEVKRLNAKNVLILGKEGAVSKKIENKLKSKGLHVKRIGGKDRYETSFLIAKEMGKVDKVAVATGKCFADSLSISSIAANKGMPILLIDGDEIPKETKDYINENKINKSYILGGTGAVSSKIEAQLPKVKRLEGRDRYKTNLAVLKEFQNEIQFNKVFLTLSQGQKDGIDAIPSSALAGKEAQSVVLVGKNYIDDKVKEFVSSKIDKDSKIIALGSKDVIYDLVLNSINPINNNNDNNKEKVEDKVLAKYAKDEIEFKIVQDSKGHINICVKNPKVKEDTLTITIFDEKGNLAYINQGNLKDGELKLTTELDNGKYKGYFRLGSMKEKISIGEFSK